MKLLAYIMLTAMLILNLACSPSGSMDSTEYSPPTVKYQPRLIYPTFAQENYWEGKPIVLIEISDKGTVEKADVAKSSGYDILDEAAIDYCKNILFNPAMMRDKPLHARLKIGVDFKLDDHEYSAKNYVREVKTLYRLINISSKPVREAYEKDIFKKHNEFVHNVKDALNFNYYMSSVLQDNTVNEWDTVWNSYPLSFLVFHDFLNRYPDFEDSSKVKMRMRSALSEDVKYIVKTPGDNSEKEALLGKIITFMKKEYPELDIDDINFKLNQIEEPNI